MFSQLAIHRLRFEHSSKRKSSELLQCTFRRCQ